MSQFKVENPGGGTLTLGNAEEVQLWNDTAQQYIDEYGFTKVNDMVILGTILTFRLDIYRAQADMTDPKKVSAASSRILKLSGEMRELEKALGIDKKSREAGGQHTVADYISNLKRAAHEKGIHISERVRAYEGLAMEARWKIRLLRNGDTEDRRHHDISERSIVDWLEKELAKLEDRDKEWAREKGRIFVGKL